MRSLLLLAVAASMTGCMFMGKMHSGVKGSGTIVKKTLTVSSFSEISHDTVGEVEVSVGGPLKVEVETDDNILPLLKNEVNGDVFKLDAKENISPTKLIYRITVPSLQGMDLEGVGSANIDGVKGSKFRAEVSGVGSMTVTGEVGELEAEVSGVGSLSADGLKAKTGRVEVSGVGGAKVNVSDDLTARCSGVGGIKYVGKPRLDARADGVGKISSAN